MMQNSLRYGLDKKEHKFWHTTEAMLLLPNLKTNSKTINVILEGWFEVRNHLKFEFEHDYTPANLTIKQAMLLRNHPSKKVA